MPIHFKLAINKREPVRVPLKLLNRILLVALKRFGPHRGSETSLAFISDSAMRNLNKRYRGRNKSTDVLSFSFLRGEAKGAGEPLLTGEILINPKRALKQAKELGHSLQVELALLFLHGLLHVLKFDHERGHRYALKMSRAEQDILSKIPRLKKEKGVIMRAETKNAGKKILELVNP